MMASERALHFPAVVYMPRDAFDAESSQVMGRRVAGRLLTAAFVSSLHRDEVLTLVSPGHDGAQVIERVVRPLLTSGARVQIDSELRVQRLQQVGALHLPDPLLGQWCWLRDGRPHHAFSITGVIHTVCSDTVLKGLQDLALAPLYPWDAVICTSEAGRAVVAAALEHRIEAMAARLGAPPRPGIGLPHLPVIPLAGSTQQPYHPELQRSLRRSLARQELGLADSAFVVAFVGRLSFHSKAHPQALYRALQSLAHSGGEVILIECGHHFNQAIAAAYLDLQRHFPGVHFRLVGGLTPATERQKWQVLAAADVFCSPADNLQETFGLSLLEAMAAELPLVVSDWDGYRDLVEHGRNGLLVPTHDLLAGLKCTDGVELAYNTQQINYDMMIGLRSFGVVIDHEALTSAFASLRSDPELRLKMGRSARNILEQRFSETAVAGHYRRLWADLAEHRAIAATQGVPTEELPSLLPPHARVFGHYASHALACAAVQRGPTCLPLELAANSMNQGLLQRILGSQYHAVLAELADRGSLDVKCLHALGFSSDRAMQVMAAFLKLGFVEMSTLSL